MPKTTTVIPALLLFIILPFTPLLGGVNDEFREKAFDLKWIAYAPTNFNPEQDIYPSEKSIRDDLKILYDFGFRGIVTYSAYKNLALIPQIAYETGFRGIIMGVWDIQNKDEIMNAVLSREYVDGYCLGNEGLNSRYELDDLKDVISSLKSSTGKPCTTTEQVSDYSNPSVNSIGDWIFPNIHPFLCEVKDPQKAALWIQKYYRILKKHCPDDKIVFFKEVGYPTRGMHKATESNQKKFFINMKKSQLPFVYFEAFDQPWKNSISVEPYWGLFNSRRKPKKFISEFKDIAD